MWRRTALRFSWMVAAALCWVGWAGISPDAPENVTTRGWCFAGAPHFLMVAVAVWAGRVNAASVVVALAGAGLVSYSSWWEQGQRQTEGFEWQFNNEMRAALCILGNYAILLGAVFGVWWVGTVADIPDFRRSREMTVTLP